MSTPFPPEEPVGHEESDRIEHEAEEHAEEIRREHEAEHDESPPVDGGEQAAERPADVPWWRRLFRRS